MNKQLKDDPAPAFPLYRKTNDTFSPVLTTHGDEIWCCGECGTLHHKWNWNKEGDEDQKRRAADCCRQKYCECGEKIERGYTGPKCGGCNSLDRINKCLETAAEVATADGFVFDDERDKYWDDIDTFIDETEGDLDDELPEWIFPCTPKKFGALDARDVIENELSDHYEDAIEAVVDIEGLQNALDAWVAKQTLESWSPDYTKKINVKKLKERYGQEKSKKDQESVD